MDPRLAFARHWDGEDQTQRLFPFHSRGTTWRNAPPYGMHIELSIVRRKQQKGWDEQLQWVFNTPKQYNLTKKLAHISSPGILSVSKSGDHLAERFSIPAHELGTRYWPAGQAQATHTPDGRTSTPDAHPYDKVPLVPFEYDAPGVQLTLHTSPSARLDWLTHVPVERVSLNAGRAHAGKVERHARLQRIDSI
jgi:hypothetical protein